MKYWALRRLLDLSSLAYILVKPKNCEATLAASGICYTTGTSVQVLRLPELLPGLLTFAALGLE
jgi:hypothetical protein